ncbi:MAG: sodium/proton antiporter NhaB [Alphaproteobacteria bacterium]|nr:MAG: sodium/proton antiporter NhaB [Alphaproteobacteria bacterium]
MERLFSNPYGRNFLGNSPLWYKTTILAFLLLNPILLIVAGPYVTGWVIVGEFIFTLAMALKCYPLQPGGLLALETVVMGLTSTETVYHEIELGLEVILLLIFMVAGIYFMRDLLLYSFTKILVRVRSKLVLSLMFSLLAAFLSAFLDALTVTAVVITIAVGFYGIYHKVASGKQFTDDHDHLDDQQLQEQRQADLEQFRAFLRSLMMHAAVGTALGGVMTLVGEPQNLIIAARAEWSFIEFFFRMGPVTVPVLLVGLLTVIVLELSGWFGYGAKLPASVRQILEDFEAYEDSKRTARQRASLAVQALVALWLVVGLSLHLAAVGVIGLSVIVLATAFTGVIEEHQIGHAFTEALPFTALLVVFFAIVAMINDQGLFDPVIAVVLEMDGINQIAGFFVANGVLSAISDNVFVATVYIGEVQRALAEGLISRDTFDLMAVAINTGTNIPSVATPNGQAAFLFLLTSALAPLIRLSYVRMVVMALPYTITMSGMAILAVYLFLVPTTDAMYDKGLISHHPLHADYRGPAEHGGH